MNFMNRIKHASEQSLLIQDKKITLVPNTFLITLT